MITERVVAVDGKERRVLPVNPGLALVASNSRPGSWHGVACEGNGFWVCGCESYHFRRQCGHITAVQQADVSDLGGWAAQTGRVRYG